MGHGEKIQPTSQKGVMHVNDPIYRLLIGWWRRLFPASFISPMQNHPDLLSAVDEAAYYNTAYVAIISGLLRISHEPSV